MKANASPAMITADGPRLARVFERIAMMGKPEFPRWEEIARAGAEAAARRDLEQVRRACRDCHDQYRSHFKARFRSSAIR